MDENLEMMELIYKTASMGHTSCENLITELKTKENKTKKVVEEINKKYEYFEKESCKILKKYKKEPKTAGIMADMMNKMGIKKEVMDDNSDPSIASMLIQGLTMGNLELDKKINNYKGIIEKKNLNIAEEFKKFGEIYIEKLKKYL